MSFLTKFLSWFGMKSEPTRRVLKGDGTWSFVAYVEGNDIVVENVTMTCFGGASDDFDSGETASGINTAKNPKVLGCALPMDYTGSSLKQREALGGSPLPLMPYKTTMVEVTSQGKTITVPIIDRGPARWAEDALDLTVEAAKFFNPKATANNFKITGSYRILGAAKYAPKP